MPKPYGNPFTLDSADALVPRRVSALFAQPDPEIYNALLRDESVRFVGGWGTGKTMLLKFASYSVQLTLEENLILKRGILGVYRKLGVVTVTPFVRPDGEFRTGGAMVYGHYLNCLLARDILEVLPALQPQFALSGADFDRLCTSLLALLRPTARPKVNLKARGPNPVRETIAILDQLREEVRLFLDSRDFLAKGRDAEPLQAIERGLSVRPTDIRSFLPSVVDTLYSYVPFFRDKRVYLLLDECERLFPGQQRVVNTLIRDRPSNLSFKLATRPPDLKTMQTLEPTSGLSDRELKLVYLDLLYDPDPTRTNYRNLCIKIARNRLREAGYVQTDIAEILGRFTPEEEVPQREIEAKLSTRFKQEVGRGAQWSQKFKDYKDPAVFQLKRRDKWFAGFPTYTQMSSGIALHFLALCGEAFDRANREGEILPRDGSLVFKRIPLDPELQTRAALTVARRFFDDIPGRVDSLPDPQSPLNFGIELQKMVQRLALLFNSRLMSSTFNQPESARLEFIDGTGALDTSPANPVRQVFEAGIACSVFQRWRPYSEGLRHETYLLNRILAPYPVVFSPRVRWSTAMRTHAFNEILRIGETEFQSLVVRTTGRSATRGHPAQAHFQLQVPELQLLREVAIDLGNDRTFLGKTIVLVLHVLRDLIPLLEQLTNFGAAPGRIHLFYKDYPYLAKSSVLIHIKGMGLNVYPLDSLEQFLGREESEGSGDVVVIEDGGYVVPLLGSGRFPRLAGRVTGAVEQTTRGITRDRGSGPLPCEVLSIPDSKLKQTFEPMHVARALARSVRRLIPDADFSGWDVAVLGYGTIGSRIAMQLRDDLPCRSVTVFDQDSDKRLAAQQSGLQGARTLEEAVEGKLLVLGCTGSTSIQGAQFHSLRDDVHLASASSDRDEFDLVWLGAAVPPERQQPIPSPDPSMPTLGTTFQLGSRRKRIHVLADGSPVNFWYADSLPKEVSDLILTLIFSGAVDQQRRKDKKPEINTTRVNSLAAELRLSDHYSRLYVERR